MSTARSPHQASNPEEVAVSDRSRLRLPVVAAAVALAVAAAPAAGHVTAQPPELPAGEFVKVTFRAPNERDVPTTRISIQFPPELDSVKVQPVPGWRYRITTERLPEPREVFGERVTEYVARVDWTAGSIAVPEFQEFPVSMRLPERGNFGRYMTFPALQTYANGEVVRWIQRPESPEGDWDELEEPAPHLLMTSAEEPEPATRAQLADVDDDARSSRTLAIGGLVVGGLALLVAALGLLRRRRPA
jgi:uncharacterized protein YcnI